MINTGEIELTVQGPDGTVVAKIYYDPAWLNADPNRDPGLAPIREVNGAALRITNNGTQTAIIRATGPGDTKLLGPDGTRDFPIPPGESTLNANQLRTRTGIQTRGDVAEFELASP